MKKKKRRNIMIVEFSIILVLIGLLNNKYLFVSIPSEKEMIQRQLDYVTISTVFAGFSFTTLGLLLGLSSEKLIEKIKDTDIVMKKVNKILSSIVFFIISVVISLIYILGLDKIIIFNKNIASYINNVLYILGIGYLIIGMLFFVWSAKGLFDLIKRIYSFNVKECEKKISKINKQLENQRKKLNENYEENELEN